MSINPEPTELAPIPVKLDEVSRTYHYPEGAAQAFHGVAELLVSASGNHRLTLNDGKLAVVAAGWRVIVIDNGGRGWDV